MKNFGIGDKKYYERYDGRKWKYYRYILSDIVQWSKPGPILDIGAGTGLFVECANRWNQTCVGIEGSSTAIKIAKKRFPLISLKKHLLSNKLPYSENSFQTVVVNQVIQYLSYKTLKKLMAEIFRVLKPGGAVFVYSPNRHLGEEITYPLSPSKLRALLNQERFSDLVDRSSSTNLLNYALYKITSIDILASTSDFIGFKS